MTYAEESLRTIVYSLIKYSKLDYNRYMFVKEKLDEWINKHLQR